MSSLKSIVTLLTFFCCVTLSAQVKMYEFQGDVYNQLAFEKKLKDLKDIYSAQGKYEFTTVSYKLLETTLRTDTIYNVVEVVLTQSNDEPLDILQGVQELVDQPLPAYELQNLQHQLTTQEDLKGKVTLLNLWFTNCRPCITEIPYLNYLKDQYGDTVNFTAITFDNHDKVAAFLDRKAFNFEHLVDATTYLQGPLNNNAYPRLILLDRVGTIRFVANGVKYTGNGNTQPQDAVSELRKQLDYLIALKD